MELFDTLDTEHCEPEVWAEGRYHYVKCHHTITRRGFMNEDAARRFIEVELHTPQPIMLMTWLGGE